MSDIEFLVEPDEWLPVDTLLGMAHPFNSQVRTERELDAIARSIEQHGYVGEPVVVNRWNQKIVSGHGRVQACARIGFAGKLPVKYIYLDSEDAHRHAMLQFNLARGHQDPDRENAEILALLEMYGADDLERDYAMPEGELDALVGMAGEMEDIELTPQQQESRRLDAVLGRSRAKVKPVLDVDQLDIFEQAIRATGLKNRGDAIIAVCQFYLVAQEGNDGERGFPDGQPDVSAESLLTEAGAQGD